MKWEVVALAGAGAAVAAAALTASCRSVLGPLGIGEYVPQLVQDAPRPFGFERPWLWTDATDELSRKGGRTWSVLILGPAGDDVMYTSLEVVIRPRAEQSEEFPVPGGPFASLDDFVLRLLPGPLRPELGEVIHADVPADIVGRQAGDLVYDFISYGDMHRRPTPSLPARERALVFEDLGYYYALRYRAPRSQFDRYFEAFNRMVSTFHFLD